MMAEVKNKNSQLKTDIQFSGVFLSYCLSLFSAAPTSLPPSTSSTQLAAHTKLSTVEAILFEATTTKQSHCIQKPEFAMNKRTVILRGFLFIMLFYRIPFGYLSISRFSLYIFSLPLYTRSSFSSVCLPDDSQFSRRYHTQTECCILYYTRPIYPRFIVCLMPQTRFAIQDCHGVE